MKKSVFLIVVLLLVACAPREQDFRPAFQPAAISAGIYHTVDGVDLPLRVWQPKVRPKAIVVALHGFNDYSNAFTDTGNYFKRRGIALYAYDQRGFGASPQTGIWAGEDNLVRDAGDLVDLLAARYHHTPIFLMGESMGGAVVLITASRRELPVSGLILSAPAVWGHEYMPVIYPSMLWLAAHTMPGYKVTGDGLKILASNNIPMLRRLGRDPLVIKATRIDTIYGLTHLMDNAYRSPEQVRIRTLMLYGFKDQVIPRAPIDAIKPRFSGTVQAIYYDDGYHMLTRDLQGKSVIADIARWILKQRD